MTDVNVQEFTRVGPRPLGLHLGLAATSLATSFASLPFVRDGKFPWVKELEPEAEKIARRLQEYEVAELVQGLAFEGNTKVVGMISGIRKYHAHPYRRKPISRPLIWSHGNVRLLDCAPKLAKKAPILFLVPSLINRAYILDLMPGKSFVEELANNGIRAILVDWGEPGAEEREYDLKDYLEKILLAGVEETRKLYPRAPLHVGGYCMGGTLAVALTQMLSQKPKSLITIAAPWDFHEGLGQSARLFLSNEAIWDSVLKGFKEMPVDILQSFFASLDPNLCMNKFCLFDQMGEDTDRAREFVALEDWLNDGVPLSAPVARSCFQGWYGRNDPVMGNWEVGSEKICPENITIPSMIVVPKSDRIVPPNSAIALSRQLPEAEVQMSGTGHIGMMVGSSAKGGLWLDVIAWIGKF
ncbi:alpha/beta fold hydrolase [Sneathiella limimaris]|uniref:alpha/beta fold hydrolase n=1 Tax=Sneathiella limimaris TaxID=1964213 RepID=UPI00146D1197|nr:alpha/beta fold hydrolase [Sneathiella limimaris]